jgi:hypothetical protein
MPLTGLQIISRSPRLLTIFELDNTGRTTNQIQMQMPDRDFSGKKKQGEQLFMFQNWAGISAQGHLNHFIQIINLLK